MRFRKLRMAFSATCLIACVLLIALWVRSYVYSDQLRGPIESRSVLVASLAGAIQLRLDDGKFNARFYYPSRWEHTVDSVADLNKSLDELRDMQANLATSGVPQDRSRINMTMKIGWHRDAETLFVPHWLLVLLTGVLAVAVGVRHPYRFSFSLRTLLIATTLIAVVLGVAVYAARK
jgi:hypothetical protein